MFGSECTRIDLRALIFSEGVCPQTPLGFIVYPRHLISVSPPPHPKTSSYASEINYRGTPSWCSSGQCKLNYRVPVLLLEREFLV